MDHPPDPPLGNHLIGSVHGAYDPPVPPVPPSNKKDPSPTEVSLYTILGILFGSFLTGGFPLYDSHPVIGSALVLGGALGLVVMAILVIWYRLKIIHALIVTIAALGATWAVFVYVLWTKPKEVIVHDPPTAEDIAKATAPIQKELDAKTRELTTVTTDRDAEKQRAESATQQLATYQTQFPTLQSQLATATNERDNFRRSLEETISQLNAARAQLGPQSPILGLDDAKRWKIFKAMQDATIDNQGRHIECQSVNSISAGENQLTTDLFSEFIELISRAWPGGNSQGFPPPPHQPFGITFVVGGHSGNAFECASHLVGALQNILQLTKVPIVLRTDQASDNLARCNSECIEIRYGGER